MKAFLTEYVIVRQIPITRLLYAFGISLVRGLALEISWELNDHKVQRIAAEATQDPNVFPQGRHLPSVSAMSVWHSAWNFGDVRAPISLQRRQKLSQYNSIEDAAELIHKSRNILILTGAGISTCVSTSFTSIRT